MTKYICHEANYAVCENCDDYVMLPVNGRFCSIACMEVHNRTKGMSHLRPYLIGALMIAVTIVIVLLGSAQT